MYSFLFSTPLINMNDTAFHHEGGRKIPGDKERWPNKKDFCTGVQGGFELSEAMCISLCFLYLAGFVFDLGNNQKHLYVYVCICFFYVYRFTIQQLERILLLVHKMFMDTCT